MSGKVLITGAAGFIGFHMSQYLLKKSYRVIGLDNLNEYYDPSLKEARLAILNKSSNFDFHRVDIKEKSLVDEIFSSYKPDYVINLAAQAGVRYSLQNPYAYVDSNIIGFLNVLEATRYNQVKHLIYASSSSVYGGNKSLPFSTSDRVDHPISLYAATKKCNELMAHTYSHLYGVPSTGLRFFTVYGPWGRPDMAYFSFTKNIIEGKPIRIFNRGDMERDFTYIDDIVECVYKLLYRPPSIDAKWDAKTGGLSSSLAPYKVYNIGNSQPVRLMEFVAIIEKYIGRQAEKVLLEMQPGDVQRTYADVSELEEDIGFKPTTSIEEGIEKFVKWYKDYYKVNQN